MTYRAGVVGCGRVGCTFDEDERRGFISTHAGAYAHTPGAELVALSDLDEKRLNRCADRYGVPGRYASYVEMLGKERLDVLSICTWNDTHLEIVSSALEHGVRAVFCEKPIADSLSAADEMIRLCAEQGVILMVDHQRRFDPVHQQVAAYLRGGNLGRIQQVTCYYTAGVANTGSHLFDLLRFCLGDVIWVQGSYSRNASSSPEDPNIDARLGFADGLVAAVQSCDISAYLIFEVSFLGTQGRLRLKSSGYDVEFEEVRTSQRFSGYRELFPTAVPVRTESSHEYMLFGVAHLLDCLKTGQMPLSSGEDGRAALEIICALRESANSDGKRIGLPLEASSVTVHSR